MVNYKDLDRTFAALSDPTRRVLLARLGDRVGALLLGDLDQELGDERPGERRGQRVGALVERVGLEVRPDEVRDEPLAGVHDVRAVRQALSVTEMLRPERALEAAHV